MPISEKVPVILIFGPTAIGKTKLLSSDAFNNSEIINADSAQVYCGMNIGTAKPEPEFLKKRVHHLIDIKEPSQQFTVGDFVGMADSVAKDIWKRGKFPVICGGTGFYFKNFIYGLPKTPKADEQHRKRLQEEMASNGLKALYKKLSEVDPYSARRINENDTYRIMRALEVFYSCGKPLSEYKIPSKQRNDYVFYLIGLKRDRANLYERINQRVDAMFEQGLCFEIQNLKKRGFNENDPGMRSIGYKEFFLAENQDLSENELRELIKRNSRRYAKRQITWFRQLESINWFNPDDIDSIANAVKEFILPYSPL